MNLMKCLDIITETVINHIEKNTKFVLKDEQLKKKSPEKVQEHKDMHIKYLTTDEAQIAEKYFKTQKIISAKLRESSNKIDHLQKIQ